MAEPGLTRARTPFLRSLRFRILLVAFAVLAAPLVFAFAWSSVERSVESSLQAQVRDAADEAVEAMHGPRDDDPDSHRKGFEAAHPGLAGKLEPIAAQRSVRIRVYDKSDALVADIDHQKRSDLLHDLAMTLFGKDGAPSMEEFDQSLGPVLHRPEALEADGRAIVVGCRTSVGSKLVMCHAVHRIPGGAQQSTVYVQQTSRRAVRALYDSRYQLIRVVAVVVPFALALAFWMGSRLVRPIETLRAGALRIAESRRPEGSLPAEAGGEVGDLARSFNTLLEKLEDRRGANQRFVADLVHELKNPVAAIRACADTLVAGPVDETRAARLARVLADSGTRLDTLVSQLLELARSEAGMEGEPRTIVDLVALAKGVSEGCKLRFPNVLFHWEGDGRATVQGVEGRLDSLLRNLLDNAAFFAAEHCAQEGGEPAVRLRVDSRGSHVVVSVSDNGPGIAPEALEQVFERFYTTRTSKQGTGLGLSLARAIAEAHGGSLRARTEPGQGATFELSLPAIETPRSP
ncbi:MAG: HAMP domain-containing histidine kinase [Deltaproteobacteria bacterium]|nr:HAMP domain-containing histidine kinase [Deltaproteobacteria bacterium]